jgi:putative inorganic carbon (HCO3(-)) transporter
MSRMTTFAPGIRTTTPQADLEQATPAYVWLFLIGLAFTMFAGHSGDLGVPVPLDRLLLAFSALLWFLDPERDRLRPRAFYIVAGVTILWTLLSWVSSGTITDSYKMFALLDRIIVPLAMFPLGAVIFSTAHRRELLLRTVSLIGIYLGIVGMLEYLGLFSLVFPGYISTLRDLTAEVRAGGPWLSPEPYGIVSALALVLSVMLFRTSTSSFWRLVAVLGVFSGLVGSVISMTRSVWGGVLAAGLVLGVILRRTRRVLPLLILVVVGVAAAVLYAFPDFQEALVTRLTTERSVYDRQNTYEAAWRIVAMLPLFGIGWGNFINQNVLWVRQADTYPVTTVTIEIHDVFLSRAAETGILGGVLWVLCFATGPLLGLLARPRTLWAAQWKLAGLAAFFIWVIPSLTSPNPYPMPNYLVWLVWGVAARGILVKLPDAPVQTGHGPA